MILKRGMVDSTPTGGPIWTLQDRLNRTHHPAGVLDGKFGGITQAAVIDAERHHRLNVTGVADAAVQEVLKRMLSVAEAHMPTEAIDTFAEVDRLASHLPKTALDRRVSEIIKLQQTCDGGQGLRYGGWINPYQFDQAAFREGGVFPIPLVGRIQTKACLTKPIHGGTCSPWAGEQLLCLYCGNQDYNFRIGRSARWLATWRHDHVYKGRVHPGLGEYTEVHGKLRLEHRPMNELYGLWEWLNQVNIIEMSHHIRLLLKVGGFDGLNLEDPHNPGKALKAGLYLWAADGFYPTKGRYSGTKQTFRRMGAVEKSKQAWDVYRCDDLDPDDCCPLTGPWLGREPWPMVLEVSA